MSGKGDKPRPTDHGKYVDNWERIFGGKQGVSVSGSTPACGAGRAGSSPVPLTTGYVKKSENTNIDK